MVWSTVFIIVGAYLVLLIIVAAFQSRLVYFPYRSIAVTPGAIGLPYKPVRFDASDGTRLSAWFIPADNARGVILFCHGNAGNISHRLESIQIFHRLGLSTLIFDYRGYGDSEGKPDEQGTYRDAEAAWRFLVDEQGVSTNDIIVFGRSLGGCIAAWLARKHTPRALILESTFTSVPDVAAKLYPFLPVRLLSRFSYNAREYVREVNCPVLIIHSRNDDIIPFSCGKRLFEAANEPKEFVQISGSHNEGFLTSGKRYEDGIESFISGIATRAEPRATTEPQ